MGKAWREVKAVDGNCALAFLCGGSVLRNATTRNWLDLPQYKSPRSSLCIFVTKIRPYKAGIFYVFCYKYSLHSVTAVHTTLS